MNDEYEIRIADFGLAMRLNVKQVLFERCGTPTYIAPEVLRSKGYGLKADLFSLGSILFNLITGKYLFGSSDKNVLKILEMNRRCDISHVIEKC